MGVFHKGQMSDSLLTAMFVVLSGGFQDAYTYVCRGKVFANAQTGNIVLMSTHLFDRHYADSFRYMIPIAAFLVGTFFAEAVHSRLKHYEKLHWRQIILAFEIVLLFAVGFLPQDQNAAANALVSFVCALQVQTFRKVEGNSYASTMCIGNLRSGVDAFCAYWDTRDRTALRKAGRYFAVILIFALGAGFGGVASQLWGTGAIWASCLLLAVSFLLMFRQEIQAEADC